MPLLEIATTQPCFRNNSCRVSSKTVFGTKFLHNNDVRLASSWKSFRIPQKVSDFAGIKLFRGGLTIRAVAILEKGPTKNTQSNEELNGFSSSRMGISGSSTCSVAEQQASCENPVELAKREKLRRMRISKANKGNTPWNKGRKHSPETIRRIKERTRLAMQDPKVKLKLVNLGHAQSEETRIRIGLGVRIGWEKRREKLMLQETCYYEYQNLIAEASRRGLLGEEELQWGSYKILNKQLEQEWIQSVEERKNMHRQKDSRNAPKSAAQRRKISEAIAAKWTDPAYRTRVRSGMYKYHGIADGVEWKPRRKPVTDGQTRKLSAPKKKVNDLVDLAKPEPKSQVQRVPLRKKHSPVYKDPLASSKLEILKNIRTQRATVDQKENIRARRAAIGQKEIEVITRAKELIAEAEKAAKALEIAAKKSSVAHASLIETRKIISEAIHYIETIEEEGIFTDGNGTKLSPYSTELVSDIEDEGDTEIGALDGSSKTIINGSRAVVPMDNGTDSLEYGEHALLGLVNGKRRAPLLSSSEYDVLGDRQEVYQMISSGISSPKVNFMTHHCNSTRRLGGDEANENPGDEQRPMPNGLASKSKMERTTSRSATTTTKKWVRGKLVEVGEGH